MKVQFPDVEIRAKATSTFTPELVNARLAFLKGVAGVKAARERKFLLGALSKTSGK